jgi:hypothetical protein
VDQSQSRFKKKQFFLNNNFKSYSKLPELYAVLSLCVIQRFRKVKIASALENAVVFWLEL